VFFKFLEIRLKAWFLGRRKDDPMHNLHKVKNILIITISSYVLAALIGCSSVSSVKSEPVLSPPGTTTTVILVRHAERAKEHGDSALTPLGRQRAKALVAAIGDKEIAAIYSPDRGRNRETVQPLATHLGVTITLIPEARLSNTRKFADEFVQEVLSKHAGGVVVWVGNKSPVGLWGGNLKEIYRRFGGPGDPPGQYDDLFIITVPDQGAVRVKKNTYGKSAGRFDQ
jgi:hypothetical protein